MSIAENKILIEKYIDEIWNKGNMNIIDELTSPGYVRYVTLPDMTLNQEGQKKRIAAFRKAFPDVHVTIEDLVAEGEKVTVRVSIRGTHQHQFQDIAPTGKAILITAIDIIRIADGRIAEHWGITDQQSLLQQIGGKIR